MVSVPGEDIQTEVQVTWELLDEDGSVWSQSDAPTADEAIAQTREQLRAMIEMADKHEARYGPWVDAERPKTREVKLAKVRRRTTIQVTAYSTTYSDEQTISEEAHA